MATPILRLGLIGHGTVGRAFASALGAHRDLLERRIGARLQLAQVAVRSPDRHRHALPGVRVHDDPSALVTDPSVDLVVEASSTNRAAQWILRALDRGVPTVTANKLAIAEELPLIEAVAARHPLLHVEGAVGGALPIVRGLRDSLAGDTVARLRGVLNATTTFVLRTIESGATFQRAVAAAHAAGYAEEDPADDLSGRDAAAKLAILAAIAWDRPVTRFDVPTRGIDAGIVDAVHAARREGASVLLVAEAAAPAGAGPVTLEVAPRILGRDDALARAVGAQSLLHVESALAGTLLWHGAGAGGHPTASALLGDVACATRTLVSGSTTGRIAA